MSEQLWPPSEYHAQIERLRAAIGDAIYLVELVPSPMQLGVRVHGAPRILLDVMDFPRPDPARGLNPHFILLDDGRGINLGRIARISRRPFDPAPKDLLYLGGRVQQQRLFGPRRLSRAFIHHQTRLALGRLLGHPDPREP
ncbi:hypothetical protein CKO35_09820 [Ectothiorhodospira shaposhnikovii]|uniref:hypothetical protein n=1 Tax=Ectothiorhodospira shaposhnikovii TaxID=1054 RepID=UPI001903BA60|nr:hypothetical protein [Ectothiorhodospira shaposhnikovii]MBK1673598.1 hypothetical protein [Ectothiorhodospira shaposhnikovii]